MDNDGTFLSNETAEEKGAAAEETVPSNAAAAPEEEKNEGQPASPGISAQEREDAANSNAQDAVEAKMADEGIRPAAEGPHIGKTHGGIIMYAAAVILVAIILYGFYNQLQYVTVSPSALPQAGNARFYEGFVYNESHLIPSSCLVFSYDPTLFNINNRTAAQLGYLYERQQYAAFSKEYSCLVVDYGYWCYTPNNICTYAKSDFVLSIIANATYNQTGQTYSFYRIVGVNSS